MPFIRLSDDYIDNPKFTKISAGAFCLWHEALAYCRRHSTDGLVPFEQLRRFRFFSRSREASLTVPHAEGANPLWVLIPKFGYKLHDYLDWNPSREEETKSRMGAAERMRRHRGKPRDAVTTSVTNAFVPEMEMESTTDQLPESRKEPWTAETFMDLFRAKWKERYGFECSLILNPIQFQNLATQLSKSDEATLRKALDAFFVSPDPFVLKSKHSLGLFMREPTKYLAVEQTAPAAESCDVWKQVAAEGPRKRSYAR